MRGGIAALLALTILGIAAPAASADPWQCTSFGYLFQSPQDDPTRHDVFEVDLATGQTADFTNAPNTTEDLVNAIGYNVLDDFMYGIGAVGGTTQLVRIHFDGSFEPVVPQPAVADLPYQIGEVDPSGHYWLASAQDTTLTWYEIDLVPGSLTYGQILNTGSTMNPTTPGGGELRGGADWSYIDGALYRVLQDSSFQGWLVRFDPATGTQTLVGQQPLPITIGQGLGNAIGATYTDPDGYLYASDNITGVIYRVNVATGETIRVADGPPAVGNDGARCASAPIPSMIVQKAVGARVRPADEFQVELLEDSGRLLTGTQTTGGATSSPESTDWPISQGRTYTITDATTTGTVTPIGEYAKSITCVDRTTGLPVPTGGSGPTWTLTVTAATKYKCTVTNTAVADLTVVKSASPTLVTPGRNVRFTLTVTNNGPSTSIGETVTDQLPSGLSFGSASSDCTNAAGTVTCAVGELAPNASRAFTITARAATDLSACVENRATVTGRIDPNLANNTAQAAVCPIEADLKITKTVNPRQAPVGGQVTYTLVVENLGPDDDPAVRVTDPLPAGVTLVSANPGQGTCTTTGNTLNCALGRLRDGGSTQIQVTAQVTREGCGIVNVARVSGDALDRNLNNNEDDAEVCGIIGEPDRYDLRITKSADDRRVVIGENVKYRLVVTNLGPDTARNTIITDTVSAPVRIVSVKASKGSCTRRIPMTCRLGNLAANQRVTVTVVAKHLETGCRQRNVASVAGAGTDTNPANNMDTVDICVPKFRLILSKVASRDVVRGGETFSYRIRVRNPSEGIARNAKVCDQLPSGVRYVSSKPRARVSGRQQCWTITRLNPGASRTFTVTVRAANGASGRKTNTATVTGPNIQRVRARDTVRLSPQATPVTG